MARKFFYVSLGFLGLVAATYDGKGNELVRLGATMGGEGAIATFNRAGEVQAQWPWGRRGCGVIVA